MWDACFLVALTTVDINAVFSTPPRRMTWDGHASALGTGYGHRFQGVIGRVPAVARPDREINSLGGCIRH